MTVAPRWTKSTNKHGVSRVDATYALLHPSYRAVLPDQVDEGQVVVFIGPPHAQALSGDEIEVLVREFPGLGREAVIFHVMPSGPMYRRYRQEYPNG